MHNAHNGFQNMPDESCQDAILRAPTRKRITPDVCVRPRIIKMTWDFDVETTKTMMQDVGVSWLKSEDTDAVQKTSQKSQPREVGFQEKTMSVPNAPVKNPQPSAFIKDRQAVSPMATCVENEDEAAKCYQLNAEDFDPWFLLSDEVILSVFSWLAKSTLARCARVCKKWNRLAFDESLWRGALDLGGRTLKKGVVGQVLDRGVTVLRLAKSEINSPLNFYSSSFHARSYRLQYLDLSMAIIGTQTLEELLQPCNALRRLSLENCEVNNNICRYIGQNRQMECLNLCMCQGLTENSLVPICNNLQRLDALNIAWTNMSRDSIVYLVISLPKSVTKLNLSGCRDRLQDEDVLQLSESCPRLSELDLSDASSLTNESVVQVLVRLPLLRYLAFSRCYQISVNMLVHVSDHPTLEALDVFGMLKQSVVTSLEQALIEKRPNFRLNKCPYSSIARPTTGGERTKIWGIRTRDRAV